MLEEVKVSKSDNPTVAQHIRSKQKKKKKMLTLLFDGAKEPLNSPRLYRVEQPIHNLYHKNSIPEFFSLPLKFRFCTREESIIYIT